MKRRNDPYQGDGERQLRGNHPEQFGRSLEDNLIALRRLFADSKDLHINRMKVGAVAIAMIDIEGLTNRQHVLQGIVRPLMDLRLRDPSDAHELLDRMRWGIIFSTDQAAIWTFDELCARIMSGFVVLLIDGITMGLALGMQGYASRSVSEPTTEANVLGAKEGFTEPIRVNMSMIRRRIKNPHLNFELMTVGERTRTDVCLVYMNDAVPQNLLRAVRRRLTQAKVDAVLTAGTLQAFLETGPLSFFSGVGVTERPDTVCGRILEGRIAILTDGVPYALVVPSLFIENFQSIDDYAYRPFYGSFLRWLKYGSFLFSILLPGLYVAICLFHPELLPRTLVANLVVSQEATPFPLMWEAVAAYLIYEVMREAGLRLPSSMGHAVSIIGGLVIGETAVRAGLISAPMIMVIALTAISSFVVPQLYPQAAVLRIILIFIGGAAGLFGLTLSMAVLAVNIAAIQPFGIPYTAPVSPLDIGQLRDVFIRLGWKRLGRHPARIEDLPGVDRQESSPRANQPPTP